MRAQGIPQWMTPEMCNVMMDHVDGSAPMTWDSVRLLAVAECISHELLRFKEPRALHPRNTVITEAGREALCLILAAYADALTGANFKVEDFRIAKLQTRQDGSIAVSSSR